MSKKKEAPHPPHSIRRARAAAGDYTQPLRTKEERQQHLEVIIDLLVRFGFERCKIMLEYDVGIDRTELLMHLVGILHDQHKSQQPDYFGIPDDALAAAPRW